jgi:hypothetical protein
MDCCKCGNLIPQGRLEALPNTKTCTPCSQTPRVGAIAVITGKTTYSELQIVPMEVANRINKAMKRQGQSPNAGMKGLARVS